MFAEQLPSGTIRTVTLTTTNMDRPLTVRVALDIALSAEHVLHVLWAAAGLGPSTSALLSRYQNGQEPRYFGVEASWEHSANRDAVQGLNTVQFAQLFLPETEIYAELDPARGWRARLSLAPEGTLGDDAEGEPGSRIRLVQEPFGVPATLTAVETDVLLKASDGEALTPLQQQVLVQMGDPIDLPVAEISQSNALATLHVVRSGMRPELVNLIPWVMVAVEHALAARELFRFITASANGMKTTKTGKVPVAEFRRLLNHPVVNPEVFEIADDIAPGMLRLRDAPLVESGWEVLQETGLITIDNQSAQLAADVSWLHTVTHEELDSYFEVQFLRLVLDQGLVDIAGWHDTAHPTLEYETAQDYADNLISSALAAPEDALHELIGAELQEFFDPDEPREHLEFTIELLHMFEPVTRRMSVPLDANLHASIETILIMFGWQLAHLWQLDLMASDGMRQPAAVSYRDMNLEVPLAADLDVATVLRPDGPQAILTYDFGDGWEMLITPVGTRMAGSAGELLAAEGACPPEDAGGPPGYEMKLLAMRNPEEFQRQFPDFESEEIRELANWARSNSAGRYVPEPDFYELDEHAMPYHF